MTDKVHQREREKRSVTKEHPYLFKLRLDFSMRLLRALVDQLNVDGKLLSEKWGGVETKLSELPARDIPRRPRAHIWLPKGQSDYEKLVRTLRVMNPDVKMDDWVVLKTEQKMKASQPFLLPSLRPRNSGCGTV